LRLHRTTGSVLLIIGGMSEGINESDRSTSISARIAFAPLYMEETVEQLLEPIELDDADLNEVAGGIGNVTTGIVASTTNSAVVGIQANTGINGGVGNANVALANEQVNVGVDFS